MVVYNGYHILGYDHSLNCEQTSDPSLGKSITNKQYFKTTHALKSEKTSSLS